MIDGASTNHFVTPMIFMNYSCILENRDVTYKSTYFPWGGGGGGGVLQYMLYRYMYLPLWRVWFSSSLLQDRVYKSESLCLRLNSGIIFQDTDQLFKDIGLDKRDHQFSIIIIIIIKKRYANLWVRIIIQITTDLSQIDDENTL